MYAAAAGRAYNPRTGTMARGGVAYGPYGARGAAEAFNPRTGAFGATRQGSGVYGSWGTTQVQRGDQWASTSHVSNNLTGATTRTMRGSGGGAAATRVGPVGTSGVGKTPSGNLYAGHDGNVYRNSGAGWQKYDSGGWNSIQKPSQLPALSQLDRDSLARNEGMLRTNDWSNIRSGGGFDGGSFRPSGGFGGGFGGGGFRGGGFGGGFRGGGRR